MSVIDKFGGRFRPVPHAQGAANQPQQVPQPVNGVFRSAVWPKQAAAGQSVKFTVVLNKPSIAKNAVIEILFNQANKPPQVFGMPIMIPAAGTTLTGVWTAKAHPASDQGWYTFRARLDNQSITSNKLTLVTDAVAAAVLRNSTDGFDR